MKLLWTKDLKMNTVHVRDVVRGLWHLRDAGPPGEVYNLADKGETSKLHHVYRNTTLADGLVVIAFVVCSSRYNLRTCLQTVWH